MNVLRQNTDYAMRLILHLANSCDGQAISVRLLAKAEDVSHQYACKILQTLHDAGLVESTMGPKGGYKLSRQPDKISMLDVATAMQGPICVNRCTDKNDTCDRKSKCTVYSKLQHLQDAMEKELSETSLSDL